MSHHDHNYCSVAVAAVCTHAVYGTIITVNNNGDNSSSCCVYGTCPCSSLSSALHNVSDNTVINITSESVTLHDIVGMGSGNLSNITITGNGATIMCNNTGGVHCESCSNITIMGITWYQCGRNDSENLVILIPALNFTNVFNMTIHKCTFQNSSGCPVYLQHALESITINDSHFMYNIFDDASLTSQGCAGLYITSERDLNISIISSVFHENGCRKSDISKQYYHVATIILLEYSHNLANIAIENADFSNNSYALYVYLVTAKSAIVQLSNVSIYNNTAHGILLEMFISNDSSIYIDMSHVYLMDNVNALSILNVIKAKQLTMTINMKNSIISNNVAKNDDSFNTCNKNLGAIRIALSSAITKVTIVDCHFYDNSNGAIGINLSPLEDKFRFTSATITLKHVTIHSTKSVNHSEYDIIASASIVTSSIAKVNNDFTNVSFISNNYSSYHGQGGVLFIENVEKCIGIMDCVVSTSLSNCSFYNNTALDSVVLLNIKQNANDKILATYYIQLSKCTFDSNFGGESIVYIQSSTSSALTIDSSVTLNNSTFSNNKGTALYLIAANFLFIGTSWFINNSANSGAAIYFEEVHSILSIFSTDIHFINNSVLQKGGALYFNLVTDHCNVFNDSFDAIFINNSANIAGNSIYFSIPQDCHINTNISDESSLLYLPNKFNYSQPGRTNSPPFVTSPYNIKLYPPATAVDNSSNNYIMQQSRMLGEPIQINASVLDCLNNITEPVIFTVICETCGDDYVLSAYQITAHDFTLSTLKVFPTASSDVINHASITIKMLSVLSPVYKSISAALVITLSPCFTGYMFDDMQQQCICYPHPDIIHCTEQYSEIKIGYWIGPVTDRNHTSSSICPDRYCDFVKRTETSQGYYYLSRKSDDQCSSHRNGVACGKCKSGYTLAYDSPDCINADKCSAGMTILVIVLTILYWIAIVAVVFSLMYFQFQISSGYVYGIIYYYSIVDILLGNNISDEVFQFVTVFSSFAKLTPQLFGELCLVKGLSGIDQQFIHYSHALAVSLILLIIVLMTRYSPRFAVFVRRCIICIICLLLLLSYTSLASTSLQLLRPLTFNDVDEVHTYSSPHIKYFTGRHLVYGIVAILCEVIIVIGLPLFLLLEPILGRRFNFVKIKPLLDQFQGCYKDKYRYFAVYYLLCRQVIILIVYVGNGDYYNKLYYLQTACIIIAMIHGWVQPYKKKLVNGLDEAILLTLVLVVNLNTFSFLSSISSQLSVVLIILPLLLLSLIGIRKLIIRCYNQKKKSFYLYNPVNVNEEFEEDEDNRDDGSEDNDANDIRFVIV